MRRPGVVSSDPRDGTLGPGADPWGHVDDGLVRERGDDAEPELRVRGRARTRVPTRSRRGGCRARLAPGRATRTRRGLPDPSPPAPRTRRSARRDGGASGPASSVSSRRSRAYARSVSSIEYRVLPSAARSPTTIDFADQARERLDDIPALDALTGRDGFGRARRRRFPRRRRGERRRADRSANRARTTSRPWREGSGAARRRRVARRSGAGSVRRDEPRSPPGSSRRSAPRQARSRAGRRRAVGTTRRPPRRSTRRPRRTNPPHGARSTNSRPASLRTSASTSADGSGSGERTQRPHVLAVDREALAARRQDAAPEARPAAPHRRTAPRRRGGARSCPTRASSRLVRRNSAMQSSIETPGRALHTERGGDDLDHGFRVTRGRELAEPCAIREVAAGPRPRPGSRGESCRRRRHR